MTEHQSDDLNQRYRDVVDRLMARYGWTLLDREEFARRVEACVTSGEVVELAPAAFHVYCQSLHAACAGAEGHDVQATGFTELHRYLYAISYREIVDLPAAERDDIVQETLLRIWQHMSGYRRPSAFLAIAAYELRNVIRPWWSRSELPVSLDACAEQPSETSDDDVLATVLADELREQVKVDFDEAYCRHPRAKQQLEAVWLKFIAGLDDETIGTLLRKPVTNVHVLRSRGLKLLRDTPRWQKLAADVGY